MINDFDPRVQNPDEAVKEALQAFRSCLASRKIPICREGSEPSWICTVYAKRRVRSIRYMHPADMYGPIRGHYFRYLDLYREGHAPRKGSELTGGNGCQGQAAAEE